MIFKSTVHWGTALGVYFNVVRVSERAATVSGDSGNIGDEVRGSGAGAFFALCRSGRTSCRSIVSHGRHTRFLVDSLAACSLLLPHTVLRAHRVCICARCSCHPVTRLQFPRPVHTHTDTHTPHTRARIHIHTHTHAYIHTRVVSLSISAAKFVLSRGVPCTEQPTVGVRV